MHRAETVTFYSSLHTGSLWTAEENAAMKTENLWFCFSVNFTQECIPVGCVPSAAVAVC